MKILIIGGGLQGLSFASSLYNKHQISVVSDDIQTKHCRFYMELQTNLRQKVKLHY